MFYKPFLLYLLIKLVENFVFVIDHKNVVKKTSLEHHHNELYSQFSKHTNRFVVQVLSNKKLGIVQNTSFDIVAIFPRGGGKEEIQQ